MTIILAILAALLFPKIYANIQPKGMLGFGEEDF